MKLEPLQYILGETEFYGYKFRTVSGALIPRPETELIVEIFLKEVQSRKMDNLKILEIGSGTGCLSITISKELNKVGIKHKIVGIDVSNDAIELSNENKKLNDVSEDNLVYVRKDFLSMDSIQPPIDFLISNPPYINKEDYNELDIGIKDYEPKIALTDDSDGLTFYRKFLTLYKLSEKKFTCITEIAYDLHEKILSLLNENEIRDFEFYDDFSGIKRVLKFK